MGAARPRKRLAAKPKCCLTDPSFAAAQLGMGPDALLHDWQTFGLLFESLCMRDLMVYTRRPRASTSFSFAASLRRNTAASSCRDTAAPLV